MKRANKSGTAAAVGRSGRTGCSALPSIESAVLNLNTAKRECWTGAEFLLSADVAEALICIDSALEQLQSAREKISASQNPKVTLASEASVGVDRVVGETNQKEKA